MNLKKADCPCWLTAAELQEAKALEEIGFAYIGKSDDFCAESNCGKVGGWTFGSPDGNPFIDAHCRGALYVKGLEGEPDFFEDGFFPRQLKAAKAAIRNARLQRKQELEREYHQLSLFDCDLSC